MEITILFYQLLTTLCYVYYGVSSEYVNLWLKNYQHFFTSLANPITHITTIGHDSNKSIFSSIPQIIFFHCLLEFHQVSFRAFIKMQANKSIKHNMYLPIWCDVLKNNNQNMVLCEICRIQILYTVLRKVCRCCFSLETRIIMTDFHWDEAKKIETQIGGLKKLSFSKPPILYNF